MDRKFLKYYVLFALVYFNQGIFGIPNQGVFYYLKEVLNLGVAKIAYITSLTTLPWTIKPLYGIISDYINLFGYRRKTYMLINYLIIAGVCLWIFFNGITVASLIGLSILSGIGFAFNDVAADGIMVTEGKKYNMTGAFQSVQWAAISVASLITGLGGGYIAKYWNYQSAYLVTMIFPVIAFIYLFFAYKEPKTNAKPISLNKECFKGIKEGIKNKQLWLGIAFLFLLYFSPGFGTALMFKMRDILQFDKIFIGLMSTTSSAFGILGALIYFKICKRLNIKKLVFWTTLAAGITTFCYLYYPNKTIAMTYAILFGTFSMISHLAILDFCARIVPEGAEAFLFAGVMSILNLGSMGSRALGGFLYPIVGLNWLIVISALCTMACLGFIPYIQFREVINEKT